MEPQKVFILPGEMYVSKDPTEIVTLLGSCVGVCLFNRVHGFGGMNHYMLSHVPAGETPSGKHGEYATELLLKMMLAHDANIRNLDASILGGGSVTGHLSVGTGIGADNIITARTVLEKYKVNITGRNIGGDFGRKIYFENWNGNIKVKKIEKSEQTRRVEQKTKDLSSRKIGVLVVDDSKTVRDIITSAISEDPQIEVVGQAANPFEAREQLLENDPDVICLDIIMPKMDGITFLKKLFQYKPKPVIIISTVAQKGSKLRQQAESIGAVDVIDKEDLNLYASKDTVKAVLINKIKAASRTLVSKKTKEELEAI